MSTSRTTALPAGSILTVTADATSVGTVRRLADSGGATQYPAVPVAVSTSVIVGPFTTPRTYEVLSSEGQVSHAVSEPDGNRPLPETAGPLSVQSTTIPVGVSQTIPANTQATVFGTLTVNGVLTVLGNVRVPALIAA